MSSTGQGSTVQGATGQGFQATTVSDVEEITTRTWVPLITPSVDGALSMFSHANTAAVNALSELQRVGGFYERRQALVIRERELQSQLQEIENKWLIDYDFEANHGKTNEKQREAITQTTLNEREDYSAIRDELDEVKQENMGIAFAIEACLTDISISKRQMDFSTALLHTMAR